MFCLQGSSTVTILSSLENKISLWVWINAFPLVGPENVSISIEDCPWARNRHSQLNRLSLLSLDKALLPDFSSLPLPGCWLPPEASAVYMQNSFKELVGLNWNRQFRTTQFNPFRGFTHGFSAQEFSGHPAHCWTLLNMEEDQFSSVSGHWNYTIAQIEKVCDSSL